MLFFISAFLCSDLALCANHRISFLPGNEFRLPFVRQFRRPVTFWYEIPKSILYRFKFCLQYHICVFKFPIVSECFL